LQAHNFLTLSNFFVRSELSQREVSRTPKQEWVRRYLEVRNACAALAVAKQRAAQTHAAQVARLRDDVTNLTKLLAEVRISMLNAGLTPPESLRQFRQRQSELSQQLKGAEAGLAQASTELESAQADLRASNAARTRAEGKARYSKRQLEEKVAEISLLRGSLAAPARVDN
jgi:predicted  nucleic acid-binding Zn-ribbon protein